MDLSFKNAILISVAVHAIGIGSGAGLHGPILIKEEPKKIEVNYVLSKEEASPIEETPKTDIARQVDMRPESPIAPAEEPKEENTEKHPEDADELAGRQEKARATADYINYYQLIREKIRRRLKTNYRYYSAEGEVQLGFVVTSDGHIVDAGIDDMKSAVDRRLRDIALKSVREASPFHPFPKELNLPRMSFNLTITFKKR